MLTPRLARAHAQAVLPAPTMSTSACISRSSALQHDRENRSAEVVRRKSIRSRHGRRHKHGTGHRRRLPGRKCGVSSIPGWRQRPHRCPPAALPVARQRSSPGLAATGRQPGHCRRSQASVGGFACNRGRHPFAHSERHGARKIRLNGHQRINPGAQFIRPRCRHRRGLAARPPGKKRQRQRSPGQRQHLTSSEWHGISLGSCSEQVSVFFTPAPKQFSKLLIR